MALLSLSTPISSGSASSPFMKGGREVAEKSRCEGFRWSCRKKEGVHPEFHGDAKVYCNGELVMTTGGTLKEYSVDVWSGNHPFYLGNRSGVLVDADQVEKFRKKYGQFGRLMEIPNLKYGEIVLPTRKKSGPSKGGKKK